MVKRGVIFYFIVISVFILVSFLSFSACFFGEVKMVTEESGELDDKLNYSGDKVNRPIIVYDRDGVILINKELDSTVRITEEGGDGYPLISPDGEKILFWRLVESSAAGLPRYELWSIGSDGRDQKKLLSPDDLPGEMGFAIDVEDEVMLDRLPFQVSWTADSKTIIFNTLMEYGYGLLTNDDLWIVDVDTLDPQQLLPDGEGGSFALSPNEQYLFVADAQSVSVLDFETLQREKLLEFPFVNTASEYAYVPQPVWSNDGTYGLIAIASPEPFTTEAYLSVWRLPITGEAELISELPGLNLFNTMDDRLWSPDRDYLVYFDQGFCISSPDGRIVACYDADSFFGWSEDGLLFLFSRGNNLYLGDLDNDEQDLALPEGISMEWLDAKWLDSRSFILLAGNYYDGLTLLYGNVEGKFIIVDHNVRSFDGVIAP